MSDTASAKCIIECSDCSGFGWAAVGLALAGVGLSALICLLICSLVPKRKMLVIDRDNGRIGVVAQYHFLPEAFA